MIASDCGEADEIDPRHKNDTSKRDPCRTLKFIAEVAQQMPKQWADLSNTLDETARNGPPQNDTKFGSLKNGLFEFKAWKIRIACFFDDNLIICTHGFYKKQNQTPQDDLEYATKRRNAYFEAKKRGEINHVQPRSPR
jgi:phage-related protein